MIDILKAISTTIELAKKAKEAADAMKSSEVKLAMAELISQLADVKVNCAELVTSNLTLKSELEQERVIKATDANRMGDCYMFAGGGPYCTACWDNNRKQISLKEEMKDAQRITGLKYVCPVCKARHKGTGL